MIESTPHWPNTTGFRFDVGLRVKTYTVPDAAGPPWSATSVPEIAMTDLKTGFSRHFPNLAVGRGDRHLVAPDLSKAVIFSDSRVSVCYFGTAPQPTNQILKVEVPTEGSEEVRTAIERKELCTFICAPIVNPLNGKTVAPDRQNVKAIARVTSRNGQSAQLQICESYYPIALGDVAADPHRWDQGSPKPVTFPGNSAWWSTLLLQDSPASTVEAGLPPLDRQLGLTVDSSSGAPRIENTYIIRSQSPRPAPAPIRNPDPQPAEAPHPSLTSAQIEQFVFAHHAKSSQGDIDGLVSDYADRIDDLDYGMVDRDFIRSDETKYHGPGVRISERVGGQISIETLNGNAFVARYQLLFERQTPAGKLTTGVSQVELGILETPGGPKITRQRSSVLNHQEIRMKR